MENLDLRIILKEFPSSDNQFIKNRHFSLSYPILAVNLAKNHNLLNFYYIFSWMTNGMDEEEINAAPSNNNTEHQNEGANESSANNDDSDEIKEIEAAEKVINSMRYYRKYCMLKLKRQADAIMQLSEEDKKLLIGSITEHMRKVRDCVAENQKLLEMIVHCGANIFGGSVQKAFEMNKVHPSTEHYMTKVKSTLKQIVRDWTEQGSFERQSCYELVFEKTKQLFPSEEIRHSIQILVTGAGLGRLAWDLRKNGFSVTGNEFSYFMLLASNFILNACQKKEEFTIYPYVLDFSNSWSFQDQLKAVKFPDVDPAAGLAQEDCSTFSMCAGDFLQVYANSINQFDAVVSVFFLDTGPNPLEYIRLVYRILRPGGYWLNFGPLTYHHEDSSDTLSLELPFQTILQLVEKCGFHLEEVKRKGELPPSQYTCNPDSMLQYTYLCGYFVARKLTK